MRLIRCNRCGQEQETPIPVPNPLLGLAFQVKVPEWTRLSVECDGETERHDLCPDCREVLLLQFMEGARVEAITKPSNRARFPHEPMTDCQLVYDPAGGSFMCYHDNPERYHKLIRDNAQDVAEGVPPRALDLRRVEEKPQEYCGQECAEAHTYGPGCLMSHLPVVLEGPPGKCTGCKHEMHDRDRCKEEGRFGQPRCLCKVHKTGYSAIPEQSRDNGENAGE